MSNEIILILSLVGIFSATLIWFILFGAKGLMCWTVIATLAANIEALILIDAFGLEQTLGNILFAATFLITDILSELYGKEEANKAVNIGIATSISFLLLSQCWFLYTPSPNDIMTPSILTVFASTKRLMLVSLVVYAIVQRLDVILYHKIWAFTQKRSNDKRKYLWLRNNVATLTCQLINTVLFTFGAFWGTYDFNTLMNIIITSYIVFIFTSLLDTPVVYLARILHEKKLIRD